MPAGDQVEDGLVRNPPNQHGAPTLRRNDGRPGVLTFDDVPDLPYHDRLL